MKSKYFREYFCSFSSKSYYFYILGVNHLKKETKKWGHPLSWLSNTTSVYNDPKYLTSSLTEIEPQSAITNQSEEIKEER